MNEWHKKTFNYRYLKQFHTGSGAPGSSLGEAGHNTVFPWDNTSNGAKAQASMQHRSLSNAATNYS